MAGQCSTKNGISEMKRELQLLTQTGKLEGRVFETEAKTKEMETKWTS